MKKILFFLTIFTSVFLFSQKPTVKTQPTTKSDGYTINIKTENLAGKTIKLSIYSGNYKQSYKIDSIKIKTDVETIRPVQGQNLLKSCG